MSQEDDIQPQDANRQWSPLRDARRSAVQRVYGIKDTAADQLIVAAERMRSEAFRSGDELAIRQAQQLSRSLERPLKKTSLAVYGLANGHLSLGPLNEEGPEEVKVLVRAFNTLMERLKTSEEARKRLLANTVHELGRPLGALLSALQALLSGADEQTELRKELLKIRGVGPYAAANLLMILGRSDFIPIDTYALKMVSHEWHRGRKVTPKHVERAFSRWGEHKGLAFWFWDWKYNGG